MVCGRRLCLAGESLTSLFQSRGRGCFRTKHTFQAELSLTMSSPTIKIRQGIRVSTTRIEARFSRLVIKAITSPPQQVGLSSCPRFFPLVQGTDIAQQEDRGNSGREIVLPRPG